MMKMFRSGGGRATLGVAALVAVAGLAVTVLVPRVAEALSPQLAIYAQVSAGGLHTCALAESGELACWGDNSHGQTVEWGGYRQVSAGVQHTCALADSGGLACWGRNWEGQVDTPSGRYQQVSAGGLHTCALAESGDLACWGGNKPSDLRGLRSDSGWGNYSPIWDWQAVAPSGRYQQVSAGGLHTCALADSGGLACWGRNWEGQVDAPSGQYKQVSAGWLHTCALAESGELACWGNNGYGQTDAPSGRYRQVSAGGYHACALAESGELACWGDNEHGQTDAPPLSFDLDTTQISVSSSGRIVARRLVDGRTEFAWHIEGGEHMLPRLRYLPSEPPIGRWLNTSDVVVEGVAVGRINVRVKAGDRMLIELAFTPAGGDRILPRSRYFSFPKGTATDVWLRSTLIEPGR